MYDNCYHVEMGWITVFLHCSDEMLDTKGATQTAKMLQKMACSQNTVVFKNKKLLTHDSKMGKKNKHFCLQSALHVNLSSNVQSFSGNQGCK